MSKKRIKRASTSGKKSAPSGVVRTSDRREIPLSELKEILSKSKRGPLSDEEVTKLEGAVDTLATLTQELEAKGASIRNLRRLLFGARTEKTSNVVGDAPADEEDENGDTSRETGDTADDAVKSSSGDAGDANADKKKRKGHGRHGSEDYTGAKKVKVALEALKAGDRCPECERGKLYPLPPSVLVRVTGIAPLAAIAYELEKLRCNACGEVFTAKAPKGVGGDKYDESAAAMIALLKYGCGMPFNRLERLEGDLGIPLPASTQWEVIAPAAAKLAAVFTELIRKAAQGDVLHNDDTGAKVLELSALVADAVTEDDGETGRIRTGVFTSGIVSVEGERRIALFFTGQKHAGENLADVLAKRAAELPPPIQMSDELSSNTAKGHETLRAGCNSHARRKYVEVAESFPDEVRHVLEEWRLVFENDAFTKAQAMSPEVRLTYHQEHSAPVMERLETWCTAQIDEHLVEPNGGLGQAIAHMKKHWEKLTLFLRVPGAPLDNNICERILKKAILHRKNALFFKTENGARVGDIFMSLIHTCELNGVNPFDYLVAMLRHPADVEESPEDWMPWNYTNALAELDAIAATPA